MENDELDPSFILEFPKPSRRGICLVTEVLPLQLLFSGYMQGVFPWFSEDEGGACRLV